MDAYTRTYYRLMLQTKFLRLKGNAFQDLFGDIMSRRYAGDFIRTRPWGNHGDRKNDGYLRSHRKLFQVYAPNEMTAAEATDKINNDFIGALPYWEQYFDYWIFVHNALDGIGPDVLELLLRLDHEQPSVTVAHMGYEAIEQEALGMALTDLEALFGHAPDARSINNLRSSDLLEVLDRLARSDGLSDVDIRPVSIEKINKNNLSDDSKNYLRMGQIKSGLVAQLFDSFPDPLKGEELAQVFRNKYSDLKLQRLSPDIILSELILYTGGYGEHIKGSGDTAAQRREAAVASVLAYLFERCDIFEDSNSARQ